MANTYRSRTADVADFADDDPFAELTRIIGHDARPRRDHHAADESLGLDLENELLGGLAEFEPHDRVSDEPASSVEQPLAEDVAQAIDAEFETAFGSRGADVERPGGDDPFADSPEAAAPQPTVFEFPQAPDWADDPLETVSETARTDADFLGDANAGPKEQIAAPDLSFDENDLALDEPAEMVPEAALEPEAFSESEVPEGLSWLPAEDAEESDAGLSNAAAERPARPEDVSGEGMIDPSTLSEADSARPWEDRSADSSPSNFDEPGEPQVDVAEDEDLTGTEGGAGALVLDGHSETTETFEASSDSEGSEPAFDYVKAAADRHDFLESVSEPGEVDPFATATEPAIAGSFSQPVPIAATEETEAPADEPQTGIHDYATGDVVSGGVLASGLAGTRSWTPTPLKPAAGQEDPMAAYPPSQSTTDLGLETAAVAPDGEDDGHGAPLIETLDIEEKPVAVFDDIDIPEPAPPEEPARAPEFDDLAVELAAAFGSMADETAAPQPSTAAPADAVENGLFNGSMARAEAGGDYAGLFDPHADAGAAFTAHEQQGQQGTADWTDDTPAEPMEPEEDFVPRRQMRGAVVGRRGLVAAALVGAVVVIGGIGVFAFSGGDAGTGEPAIVKASSEPIKVKPKNPGGSTVPDQSNEVYRRASGAPVDQQPEQKELVTTAEKPIDLQQNDQPRIVDASAVRPRSDEGALDAAMSEQAEQIAAQTDVAPKSDATAKSDDRLTPSDTAPEVAASEPAITVTPHRVNTFIVKPDGTMVPREVPAEVASIPESAASGLMAESTDAAASEEGDATASLAAPETAAAPASPAAEAPAVHPTPAPEPAPQVASREPVAAPEQPLAPAASSEWSVQISSQPTAEAAQQSYQNMAQRYGDLLTGRGVNIVKADIAGKGTYYRVRIPSASKDDAINLCSRLKDAGGNCFVSK